MAAVLKTYLIKFDADANVIVAADFEDAFRLAMNVMEIGGYHNVEGVTVREIEGERFAAFVASLDAK